MNIPKSITVLGTRYKVKMIKEDPPEMMGSEYEFYGLCDKANKIIYISEKHHKNKNEMMITFLHEVGHAIFAEGSLNQTSISRDMEEIISDLFSRVYGSILLK